MNHNRWDDEQKRTTYDDNMPAETDFSKKRGKFYHASAKFSLPVYLDEAVQDYLVAKADAKGNELSELVSDLLKREKSKLSRRSGNWNASLIQHVQRQRLRHSNTVHPCR